MMRTLRNPRAGATLSASIECERVSGTVFPYQQLMLSSRAVGLMIMTLLVLLEVFVALVTLPESFVWS